MQIIVGHTNTDFDCLACMLAAAKLYPRARPALSGHVDRNVREFLTLYGDLLRPARAADIPLGQVKLMVVVDTSARRKLGRFAELVGKEGVEIHVYDHHPAGPDPLPASVVVNESLGSTTSVMLRLLRGRSISITPAEATLFLLGIYEDSGCLTHSTVTPEDAEHVAYLLRQGANLDIVANYVHSALTPEQKVMFNDIILHADHHTLHGMRVVVSCVKRKEYVGDVGLLTQKLMDVENVDAAFVVASLKRNTYIIGRSREDNINAGAVLGGLGGGGHNRAASAVLKSTNLEDARKRLLEALERQIKPTVVAADLMSYPVRTIRPDTSIGEAGTLMLRHGHSGLVVAEGEQVVGVVSRKDVDKANLHGLAHAPVKGFMSRQVITAAPDTPLPALERMLIEHEVGRLPIVENGKVVGIVTRTDLLRALYGAEYHPRWELFISHGLRRQNVLRVMQANLDAGEIDLLRRLGDIGEELKTVVFAVGGFVRDMLLGAPHPDLDLLVEGDGILFAERIQQAVGGRLRVHQEFSTASLALPHRKIDVASARSEYYPAPASLPAVEHSSVKDDLYRRDFTINAMAIQLNPGQFGDLLDFFGGKADLEQGLIRALHNLSFVDDPTRIFRAVRFESRYNFVMEPQTEQLARQALAADIASRLTGERVRDQLVLVLSDRNPIKGIERLADLDLLRRLDAGLNADPDTMAILAKVRDNAAMMAHWLGDPNFPPWTAYFIPLLRDLREQALGTLCAGLRLSTPDREAVITTLTRALDVVPALHSDAPLSPGRVWELLRPLPAVSLLYLMATVTDPQAQERLRNFLTAYRRVQLEVRGHDLVEAGCAAGPLMGEALHATLIAKLDGLVAGKQAELDYALNWLRQRELAQGLASIAGAGEVSAER